jgi:hypothetical protein
VETVDGWVDLNGPRGIERLPWDSPIHVLTAWNLERRTDGENETWEADLEKNLWARNPPVHRAFGTGPDGFHREDRVAVSGLSRDEARHICAQYDQDAVFEVLENTVFVVACSEDLVFGTPRRPKS